MTMPVAKQQPGVVWLSQLHEEVRRRLKAACTSQIELANYLGITDKHLSQVLTGATIGSPELIDNLARAMGLRITISVGDSPQAPLPMAGTRGRKYDSPPTVTVCLSCRLPITGTGRDALRAPSGVVHSGLWKGVRCPTGNSAAQPGETLNAADYISTLVSALCPA